jgi:hypothetical protein
MENTTNNQELRLIQLEKQIKLYRWVFLVLFLVISLSLFLVFQRTGSKRHFTELDVERINIIEPNGQLALVLANTERLPEPLIAGKTIQTGRTGPGFIFYDGKGWEVGGLIYGTKLLKDTYYAGAHFSFDQFRNDQVVFLSYQDNGKGKAAGLYVVDRSRKPTIDEILKIQSEMEQASDEERAALKKKLEDIAAHRLFVGSENDTALVQLRDRKGRERIRLSVNPDGNAQLLFLDEKGKVVYKLP